MSTQPDPSTGHSIFSLIPEPRRHDDGRGDSRDLSVEVPHADAQSQRHPDGLEEKFPSALMLLTRVWGTPEAVRAFRALILDGKGQVRHWPPQAWEEIVLLRNIHDAAYIHGADLAADIIDGHVDLSRYPVLEVRYRHVLDRLGARWGAPEEFTDLFYRLIIDDRGDRHGWPADAWSELVFLQQVHDIAYGKPNATAAAGPDPKITFAGGSAKR